MIVNNLRASLQPLNSIYSRSHVRKCMKPKATLWRRWRRIWVDRSRKKISVSRIGSKNSWRLRESSNPKASDSNSSSTAISRLMRWIIMQFMSRWSVVGICRLAGRQRWCKNRWRLSSSNHQRISQSVAIIKAVSHINLCKRAPRSTWNSFNSSSQCCLRLKPVEISIATKTSKTFQMPGSRARCSQWKIWQLTCILISMQKQYRYLLVLIITMTNH